jgi:hypothetical protein
MSEEALLIYVTCNRREIWTETDHQIIHSFVVIDDEDVPRPDKSQAQLQLPTGFLDGIGALLAFRRGVVED